MLLSVSKRRFTLVVVYVLFLIMLFSLNILSGTAFAQYKSTQCSQSRLCSLSVPASISAPAVGALTVTSVYTRDGSGNNNATFKHSDAIQYAVYVNNSSGNSITAIFHFEAFWGQINDGSIQIYDQIFQNITLPAGLSGWYVVSNIPTYALSGAFTIQIRVGDENNSQNYNTGRGNFTVTAGKLVIPSTGTVTQWFLDDCSKCTREKWYSSYFDQNNKLRPRPGAVHSGVDISSARQDCLTSKPIYAAGAGTVIWAGWAGPGFGWSVVIKHGYGFMSTSHYIYTLYGHMGTLGTDPNTSQSCLQVKVRDKTDTTTLVGYQGSSGLSKAATHVHFTIFAGDTNVTQAQMSSINAIYDLPQKYSTYPASHDFYLCMPLTLGDSSPLNSVNYGDNKC